VKKCPHCCGVIEYENSVDQTNGETEHPATRPGKKVEIGFDEDWRSDHYGNRYVAKVLRYAPASTSWTVCSQEPDPEPVRPPLYTIQFVDSKCGATFVLTNYDSMTRDFRYSDVRSGENGFVFDSEESVNAAMSSILLTYRVDGKTWRDFWNTIEVIIVD